MTKTDPYTMPERRLLIAALIGLSQSEGWPMDQRQQACDLAMRIARQRVPKTG